MDEKFNNKLYGIDAENFVKDIFEKRDYQVNFVDSFYDFELIKDNKKIQLEVKSAVLRYDHNCNRVNWGRFDFTDYQNRKLQIKHNTIYCFVVRVKDYYLLLGFLKARSLKFKKGLYIKNLISKHNLKSLGGFEKCYLK